MRNMAKLSKRSESLLQVGQGREAAAEQQLHCSPLFSTLSPHSTVLQLLEQHPSPVPRPPALEQSPILQLGAHRIKAGGALNAFSRQIGKPEDHTLL